MADCEILADCLFFNDQMNDIPAVVDVYKEKYCRGENTYCARYMVFKALGRNLIPGDLYPHQTGKAREVLRQHDKST